MDEVYQTMQNQIAKLENNLTEDYETLDMILQMIAKNLGYPPNLMEWNDIKPIKAMAQIGIK
jgi:hypothetical protein